MTKIIDRDCNTCGGLGRLWFNEFGRTLLATRDCDCSIDVPDDEMAVAAGEPWEILAGDVAPGDAP